MPRADLGGITKPSRLRRGTVAATALAVITTGPIIASGSSTATAQPPVEAEPTSTTQEFQRITADFLVADPAPAPVFGPPAPVPPARQGMGDNPATVAKILADRAESAPASRARTQRPVRKARAVAKPVARKSKAKVVKVVSHSGAGRHRAAPKPRTKVVHRVKQNHSKVVKKRPVVRKVVRKAPAARGGMSRVVSFAWANVGRRYGGQWDCSGFVKKAYARIGITLPHSSGGIRARSKAISRSAARPGDLVIGPGHVGIYMGGGKMIDAGNSRVGISYRKMYRGLYVARLR